ncbi:MATE family efflux transporter [Pseudofulvibacter geojedonensis]|uniref:MATE family efflux transporter n=1 Tax=Pseudofulvibacter geojedonensis TaxID=1123758 RepID=A0ABW3I2N4_9FLAO
MATLDIKTEKIWKLILKFSLPGVFGSLILSIGTMIDASFLGYYLGSDAFAATSLVFPLTVLTGAIIALVSVGASSLLSRALGSEDTFVQQNMLSNVFSLSILFSLVLTCLGYFFASELVGMVGATGSLKSLAETYFKIYILGSFFNVFGLSANNLIRAEGKIKFSMGISITYIVINIILTPLFINVFDLGLEGAVWASLIAMGVYALLVLGYFLSKRTSYHIGSLTLRWDQEIIFPILKVGSSAFSLHGINFIRQLIIFRSITYYGTTTDVAFFSAAYRIFMFLSSPVLGFLSGLPPVIGINFGANQPNRIKEAVYKFRIGALGFLSVVWLPIYLFPTFLFNFLLPDLVISPQQLQLFRIIFFAMPMLPLISSSIMLFQSIGDGKLTNQLVFYRQLFLFLPLILTIPYFFSATGVYYSLLIENVIYGLIVLGVSAKKINQLKFKLARVYHTILFTANIAVNITF